MKIRLLAVATTLAVTLAGCASSPANYTQCMFPNTDQLAPTWICDEPVEGVAVSAVGSSPKSSAGVGFMRQMATAEARVQLAQAMRIHVGAMIKQYVETTGTADNETVDKVSTSVTKQITDETLVGSRLYKSVIGPDGSMYVLVGMDDNTTQQAAQQAIRTSMNNDRAAWQQFRAQKGQDELAEAIAASKMPTQ